MGTSPTLCALAIVTMLSMAAGPVAPASGETFQERVESLEIKAEESQAIEEDLDSRLANLVEISGYIDTEFIASDKEGENNRFRIHHFSVFFRKTVSETIEVFTEIEYEDAPYIDYTSAGELKVGQGKLLVEQVYSDLSIIPQFTFRLGRYLTPAGIWSVNHYPPFVPTQTRPLHIRKIFPQYVDGIQAYGQIDLWFLNFLAHFYAGNGEGNSGKGDGNDDKAFGARAEFDMPLLPILKVGLSYYQDVHNDGVEKNAYGVDGAMKIGPVRMQAEYAVADHTWADNTSQSVGYYAQAIYEIGHWAICYRYDFYDPSDQVDNDAVTANTGALNYRLTTRAVLKLEANSYEPEGEPGYLEWIVSAAVMF